MKRILLGTTALVGGSLLATSAFASDGVKLSLGGYITNAFGVAFDDDQSGEAGDDINLVGIGTDAEIHFMGETTLDNGLTVGARFELEGGDEDGDQLDQAYAYFNGGFGAVRIGLVDGAAGNMYMLPPGSTANFGPYSPNTTGAALSPGIFDPENTLTQKDKPQKIVYYSPVWSGFSFGLSYTPNDDEKRYNDGDNVDAFWRPDHSAGSASNDVGLGAHYEYKGDEWGLNLGGAAYWEGKVKESTPDETEQAGYNLGATVSFGGLQIGAAGTYFTNGNGDNQDIWLVGTGLAYTVDTWTVGGGWAHVVSDVNGFSDNDVLDRAGVTVNYDLGPGIALDGGVFYTWNEAADDVGDPRDNYDAIEFSVGSSIRF